MSERPTESSAEQAPNLKPIIWFYPMVDALCLLKALEENRILGQRITVEVGIITESTAENLAEQIAMERQRERTMSTQGRPRIDAPDPTPEQLISKMDTHCVLSITGEQLPLAEAWLQSDRIKREGSELHNLPQL